MFLFNADSKYVVYMFLLPAVIRPTGFLSRDGAKTKTKVSIELAQDSFFISKS